MKTQNSLSELLLYFFQSNTSNLGTVSNGCVSFLRYLEANADSNESMGNISASKKLKCALNRFRGFLTKNNLLKNGDCLFMDINKELLQMFENDMKGEFLSLNTTSFYMRLLRSYFHKGIKEGLYFSFYDPFESVYTGIMKTRKRAVDKSILKKIKNSILPENLNYDRDLFLFSFYTRGMSFIDMANLTAYNITNNEIRYYRSKTGKMICVRIEPCIKEIIDKYSGTSGSDYIFPIHMNGGIPCKYSTSLRNYNNHLKKISKRLKLDPPLTSYVSRHTWASIAKNGGIPVSIISEAMGHTSERTTHIYLASMEQSTIDDANSSVIRSLV